MPLTSLLKRVRGLKSRILFWLPQHHIIEEQRPEVLHDHALVLQVVSPERVPRWRQFRYIFRILSPFEKRIFLICAVLGIACLSMSAALYARSRIISVPVAGGTYIEGLVGQPKYLNPVDSLTNDVDQDLVRLVYSGLFRYDGLSIVPDLAEQYAWSEDQKTLTIHIRQDARFHDNAPLTSEDVHVTIDAIQNPDRKSPLAPLFRGIHLTLEDEHTISFTLERPDPLFLHALTVGILPAHLWQNISGSHARLTDLNIKPVGSGPYRIKQFSRDSLGAIHSYTLERFANYYGTPPHLDTVVFQFFPDRQSALDAFRSDAIDGIAFVNTTEATHLKTASPHTVLHIGLPQETVAFFNVKDKILSNPTVRQALAVAVQRTDIVTALQEAATPVSGPYPFAVTSTTQDVERARTLLAQAGWILSEGGNVRIKSASSTASNATSSRTELQLTISIPDEPDSRAVAETLQRQWSVIGARVLIEALPTEELMRRATRERRDQITLINVLMGPEQDLFPFWWSGQATDRGFNLSNLSDRTVDDALEKTRTATTTNGLEQAREELSAAIQRLTPAVFLVRPFQNYVVSKKILGGESQTTIASPAERLQGVMRWYVKTGWRWK